MSKELFIPMSSLQCAYMIERERGLKTTGTPCHVYMEFDTVSINETHLRKAWETLYVRHPMMRAKAEMCGLLKIEELNDREAERTIKIFSSYFRTVRLNSYVKSWGLKNIMGRR